LLGSGWYSPGQTTALSRHFAEVVRDHFDQWDLDQTGVLTPRAVEALIVRPTIHGPEAAALAAIHRLQKRKSHPLPALTQDWLTQGNGKAKDFPPFESLYRENWKHISQLKRELFAEGAPSLQGSHQGHLGDCYLIAAVGAAVNRNPAAVQRLFVLNKDQSCSLHLPGGLTVHVPVLTDAEVALGASASGQGLWLNYLEKGYGIYKKQSRPGKPHDPNPVDTVGHGGDSCATIRFLTGHHAEYLSLHHGAARGERGDHALLAKAQLLLAAADARHLVCCSTGKGKLPPGVADDHVYAVLGYNKQTQAVEVWNPWGNKFEPKGQPGLEHGYPTAGGRFSLPLREFVQVFSGLYYETNQPARGQS